MTRAYPMHKPQTLVDQCFWQFCTQTISSYEPPLFALTDEGYRQSLETVASFFRNRSQSDFISIETRSSFSHFY